MQLASRLLLDKGAKMVSVDGRLASNLGQHSVAIQTGALISLQTNGVLPNRRE
jgi:hypothetical protein